MPHVKVAEKETVSEMFLIKPSRVEGCFPSSVRPFLLLRVWPLLPVFTRKKSHVVRHGAV